jgi:hypothetical protein
MRENARFRRNCRRLGAQAPPEASRSTQNNPTKEKAMDIERVNAIGATLHDMSARTEALRGYL